MVNFIVNSSELVGKCERPWERRGFRHPDLLGWTLEHRADLVWAVLVGAGAMSCNQ